MTDNPISDNQKTGGMKPQTLNAAQKRQLAAAKTALRKYQAGVAKNAVASAVLTEQIALSVETGITRYRLAQELGMTHQAVDGRLDRRAKKRQSTGG